MSRGLVGVVTCALLTGCAGYNLKPIAPGSSTHNPSREGYVFYAPAPFLMGTLKAPAPAAGGGGGAAAGAAAVQYDFKIVYLPDSARPYRFTRYEFLAKSNLKITFADGWLFTGAESSTDTTQALTALVDLLELGKGIATAALNENQPLPTILLYRIDINGNDAALVRVPIKDSISG